MYCKTEKTALQIQMLIYDLNIFLKLDKMAFLYFEYKKAIKNYSLYIKGI